MVPCYLKKGFYVISISPQSLSFIRFTINRLSRSNVSSFSETWAVSDGMKKKIRKEFPSDSKRNEKVEIKS